MRVFCCICEWLGESLGICGMELSGQLDPLVPAVSSLESSSCDLPDLTFGDHMSVEDR